MYHMYHNRASGSVSVFLACILMLLIVFACSIVDITRIHIARGQAERALYTSGQSILASYDSQLSSQYGIFAKDFSSKETIKNNVYYYANSSLNPKDVEDTSSFTIQYLFPQTDAYNFYDYDVQVDDVSVTNSLVSKEGIAYTKLQILQFMKYRAPMVALEPFLENFSVMGKASKTSEIIKKKNEVVSGIVAIENEILELEMYVDGLIIDQDNVVDTTNLYDYYIKKIVTSNDEDQVFYEENYISDKEVIMNLKNSLYFIDDDISYYKTYIEGCHNSINSAADSYKKNKEIDIEISDLDDELDSLNRELAFQIANNIGSTTNTAIVAVSEEIREVEGEISDKESLQESYQESIENNISLFNNCNTLIYMYYLPRFQGLQGEYCEYEMNGVVETVITIPGYLSVHQGALGKINSIQAKTEMLRDDINQLKSELENKDDAYIEATCTELEKELAGYEQALGLSNDDSDNVVSNLGVMEEVVNNNIEILTNIQEEIEGLSGVKESLYTYWIEDSFTAAEMDLVDDFLSLTDEEGNPLNLTYNGEIVANSDIEDKVINWLDSIEADMNNYSRELYFQYPSFNEEVSSTLGDWFSNLQQTSKNLFPESDFFINQGILLDGDSLPSAIIGEGFAEDTTDTSVDTSTNEGDVGTENLDGFLDGFSEMGEKLNDAVTGVRDTLYINEYIIGMFKSATDNLTEGGKDIENMTLNNYSKDKHYLNYEVEYIINGSQFDYLNVIGVAAMIFGIRVVFNIIHIITSANKMNQITNFSNAVAGWWSFGIGTIIITAVLTLIWASLEAAYDVQELLNGDKVPILKTDDSWSTDVFGGLKKIAEEVATEAMEEAVGQIVDTGTTDMSGSSDSEELLVDGESPSLIPELSYNDYLRFLLLLGIVDEETKIIRILDLIQVNLETERGEDVALNDYAIGFDCQGTFEVDYIFFKLPFMPDNIKNLGDRFTFTANSSAFY